MAEREREAGGLTYFSHFAGEEFSTMLWSMRNTGMRDSRTLGLPGWAGLVLAVGTIAAAGAVAEGAGETNAPVPAEQVVTNQVSVGETNEAAKAASPVVAQDGVSGFELRPGLKIELVAKEPTVVSPVAMAFDENGRMFVVERDDFVAGGDSAGRVRMLEDPDGEGTYGASTLLAEDLRRPSAVVCYEGGVFVGASPDLLYLKDTLREGRADVRRVAFTGLGPTNKAGPMISGLVWGPDNRIYGGGNVGGRVTSPMAPHLGEVLVWNSDWSFDPRTLAMRPETGPSQSGLAFHPDRTRFLTDFGRPLRRAMYEQRYFLRAPFFSPAPGAVNVVEPGLGLFTRSAEVAEEEERRTEKSGRGTNVVSTMPMQNAQGTMIYGSTLFGTNFLGNAFIADPVVRVVHRVVLRQQGFGWVGTRGAEERRTEFLRSTDPGFRPMQVVEGPEGAIYVVDAREDGRKGRIYRVVPEKWSYARPPRLATMKTYDLVASLAHTNGWQRQMASRMIFEREDVTNSAAFLGNMLANSRSPLARVNALQGLDGVGMLNEKVILLALRSTEERVREAGVRYAESLVNAEGNVPETVWNQLMAMTGDASVRVRYQLAFTLGSIRRPARVGPLAEMLRRDLTNPWMRTAVYSSAGEGAGDIAVQLARDGRLMSTPQGREVVRELGLILGTAGRAEEVTALIDYVVREDPPLLTSLVLLAAVGEGMERRGLNLASADPGQKLQRFYTTAFSMGTGPGTTDPVRLEALRLLGASPMDYTELGDLLILQMINRPMAPELLRATLWTIGQFADPRLGTNLLARWSAIPQGIRSEVVTSFLMRPNRVPEFLQAVAAGNISPGDVASTQVQFVQALPDTLIRQQSLGLFGPVNVERPAALDQYRPALETRGLGTRGRTLYLNRCAGCHEYRGEGRRIGPALDDIRSYGKGSLMTAILEPDLQIRPGYDTTLLQTQTGLLLFGVKEQETRDSIVLRHPLIGSSAWPRSNLILIQPQPWSLMPKGVEQGMSVQDMADLLEYLMQE